MAYTGQHYNSRIISGPRAEEAAGDFVKLLKGQTDIDFPFTVGPDGEAQVDLEEWPDGEAFGNWFAAWAQRWDLKIED
jgi:hypothetical protein